jgi:phage shock protein C
MEKKEIRKFFRSRDNKIFFGIIGGVGEYFELDPAILRFFYVLMTFFTGFFPGFLAYIVSAFIIPKHANS